MRKLSDVIKKMKLASRSVELNNQLDSVLNSLMFAAPELEVTWWNRVAEILTDEIPELNEDWHYELAKVFSGKDCDFKEVQ